MPPETPSFPSTTITWMYVLYLPTFPPHHPSFHRSCFPRQGLHASPQPTFPAREGRHGTCRGAPGCRGLSRSSLSASKRAGRICMELPAPSGQGRATAGIPLAPDLCFCPCVTGAWPADGKCPRFLGVHHTPKGAHLPPMHTPPSSHRLLCNTHTPRACQASPLAARAQGG